MRHLYAGLVANAVLPATVAVLGGWLADDLYTAGVAAATSVAVQIVAAVTEGYIRTDRVRYLGLDSVQRCGTGIDAEVQRALREGEARFRAVFTNAGNGIIIGDPFGRIIDSNPSFAAMLGYRVDEIRGRDVRDFIHPDEVPRMMHAFHSMLQTGDDVGRYDRRYIHRDGHVVPAELTASFVRSEDGIPVLTVVLVCDITERYELQQRLQHQATHDPLTGLPNRALLQERLGVMLRDCTGRVGLCFLDLDRFKEVNDRLGHEVGDRLLVAMARRLDAIVSSRGHIVRGGLHRSVEQHRRVRRGADIACTAAGRGGGWLRRPRRWRSCLVRADADHAERDAELAADHLAHHLPGPQPELEGELRRVRADDPRIEPGDLRPGQLRRPTRHRLRHQRVPPTLAELRQPPVHRLAVQTQRGRDILRMRTRLHLLHRSKP